MKQSERSVREEINGCARPSMVRTVRGEEILSSPNLYSEHDTMNGDSERQTTIYCICGCETPTPKTGCIHENLFETPTSTTTKMPSRDASRETMVTQATLSSRLGRRYGLVSLFAKSGHLRRDLRVWEVAFGPIKENYPGSPIPEKRLTWVRLSSVTRRLQRNIPFGGTCTSRWSHA